MIIKNVKSLKKTFEKNILYITVYDTLNFKVNLCLLNEFF